MTFDPKKPVRTRDGRKARILCTDWKNNSERPILCLIERKRHQKEENSVEHPVAYDEYGKPWGRREETDDDLVNIPERIERWHNVYVYPPDLVMGTTTHLTKLEANEAASTSRKALIKLVYESETLIEVTLEKEP